MKRILVLLILLTGCAPQYQRTETVSEQLNAFLFADNKLYVIGERNDYEFTGTGVNTLQTFLASKYANNILHASVTFETEDNNRIRGIYRVYLEPKTLSAEQQRKLTEQYHFFRNSQPLLPQDIQNIKRRSPHWVAHDDLFVHNYIADGSIVRLSQRTDMLNRFRLKEPIIVEINTRIYSNTLEPSLIFLPLTAIPMGITFGIISLYAPQ